MTLPEEAIQAFESGTQIAAEEAAAGPIDLVIYAVFGFGIAVTGVLLSSAHTGMDLGNPYLAAGRRLLPWMLVWIVVGFSSLIGFIFFVVPGIIISIRLFWADEFALIHSRRVFAAVRESWALTKGHVWEVFRFHMKVAVATMFVTVAAFMTIGIGLVVVSLWVPGVVSTGGGFALLMAAMYFVVLVVTYGAAHGPELVFFYGLRASKELASALSDTPHVFRTPQ